MKTCPVCQNHLDGCICTQCDFDISCHYAAYPTLAPISAGVKAVSPGNAARTGRFRCPGCGSQTFFFHPQDNALQCTVCGQTHPLAAPAPIPLRPCPPVVSVSDLHVAVLQPTGAVAHIGKPLYRGTPAPNPIAIASSPWHIAFLHQDGTVSAFGDNDDQECETQRWKRIQAVVTPAFRTLGLRHDGTVISTDPDDVSLTRWNKITSIAAHLCGTAGLKGDGTVVFTNDVPDPSLWTNIAVLTAGEDHFVGLRKDGTVVSTSVDDQDVTTWRDIVAIAAGFHYTLGLRRDGTVVASGKEGWIPASVQDWTGIAAIYAGDLHAVGVRADGSLITTTPLLEKKLQTITTFTPDAYARAFPQTATP